MSLMNEAKDCLRVYLNKPSPPLNSPKHQTIWKALLASHTQNGFIGLPFMVAWADYLDKEFFSQGVSPNTVVDGGLALRATYRGSTPEIMLAVKYGQNLNLRTSRGIHQTALHRAASRGSTGMVTHLMLQGASARVLTSEGTSPLWVALNKGRFPTAAAMLTLDASLRDLMFTERDSQGNLALESEIRQWGLVLSGNNDWYPWHERFLLRLLDTLKIGLDEPFDLTATPHKAAMSITVRDMLGPAPQSFLDKLKKKGLL